MFQLILVVLAISLMAVVVAGGITTLKADFGVRTVTTELVMSNHRALEAAIGAFRLSNGGALPTLPSGPMDGGDWMRELAPYFPYASSTPLSDVLKPPTGMVWSYGMLEGRRFICLSTQPGTPVQQPVHEGVVNVMTKSGGSFVGKSCTATTLDTTYDGMVAIRFTLQAAS